MSLTASLNTALAGLGISSRRAEIIASNVANADAPGYARRRLLAGLQGQGPISRAGVGREVSPQLQALRRDAQSRAAGASVDQAFQTRLERVIGDPADQGSLQNHLAKFDAALLAAATDPAIPTRLASVSQSASDLVGKVNDIGRDILDARQRADTEIGATVDKLNSDLQSVARLNTNIQRLKAHGQDPSPLMDQRQLLIDSISEQIPIRQLTRDNDTIALVSHGGVMLLDGNPAEIGFTPRAPIKAEMESPTHLSPLTVNGRNVETIGSRQQVGGGRLGALFELRDVSAPTAMERIDAFALELATRLQDPAVDTTLPAGQPGLFTDDGAIAGAASMTGLSLRLAIANDAAPSSPGTHWKIRDGLGGLASADATDPSLLRRMTDALGSVAAPVDATLGLTPVNVTGLAAEVRSLASLDRTTAEDRFATFDGEASALADLRDGAAVDTDEEMRRLLEVEQAYAANARLIQTIGEMMDRLTEI